MVESGSSVHERPETQPQAGPRKLLGPPGGVKGRSWVGRALPLLFGLSLVAACSDRERGVSTAKTPAPTPALRLVVYTDLAGALEPCGCQSRPLGGLDRAAAKLSQLRAERTPLLLLAAGDLLLGNLPEGATSGTDATTQELWKAETALEILGRLGLAAATPGVRDMRYGREAFAKLAAQAKFRWLPGLEDKPDAPAAFSASWVTTVGSTRVGLIGVSGALLVPAGDPPLSQLSAAVGAQIKSLRESGAQVVIGLFNLEQRSARQLAGAVSGLDFAILGGLDSESAPAPSRAGQTQLLRAGRDGQGLLVVDLYPRAGAAYEDISEWSRREQNAALGGRIQELDAKIRGWERDPQIDRTNLDQQRAKLAELRAESKQLASRRPPSAGAFDARFEELGPELQPDAEVGSLMDAYDARINAHNQRAFADLKPPAPAPGGPHYAGSEACRSCHSAAFNWWSETKHGRAYTTLETRHKQFNLSCVGCHVTGYNKPGGAAVVQNQGLVHVGCESCHGPGSKHVAEPDTEPPPFLVKAPGAEVCKECHTPEHSDHFEFDKYVARLRAPGHGQPIATP